MGGNETNAEVIQKTPTSPNQNVSGIETTGNSVDDKKSTETTKEDLAKSQKEAVIQATQQLQEFQQELEEDLSLGGIRREKRKLEREVKRMSKTGKAFEDLNKVTFKKALLTLDLEDRKNFNTYLKKVINKEIDPAIEKFQPQNEESFVGLLKQMPYLSGYIKFTRVRLSNGGKVDVGVISPAVASQVGDGLQTGYPMPEKKNFREGGALGALNGRLDTTKMNSNQKAFWKGTSNLLVVGGAVFVGWKMLSSAFKLLTNKDEGKGEKLGGNLARLALPLGLTFAANATSGGSLMDIFKGGKLSEKLSDWMGLATGKISEAKNEFKDTYSKGFMSAGALFSGLTMGETKKVLEKGPDGKIKISDSGYQSLKQAHESRPNDEKSKLALQYLNKGSANDNLANLGLNAIFGDYDKLMEQDDAQQFDKLYAENIKRFSDINQYIEKNKYTTVNVDDFKDEITSYIREGKPTLEELDKMGAFLETPVEITKNLNLNKIEAIKGIIEKKGKVEVKIGKDSAKLLKGSNAGEVLLQSENGKSTVINLDTPSIKGLGDESDRKFVDKDNNNDYCGAITAANKLNGFKNAYENRKYASGSKAFELKDGKIYFNEAKTGGGINNIEVMDDGVMGLFSEFPEVFKGQEQQIVNYLNKEVKVIPETTDEVVKYFTSRNMDVKLANNNTTLESHGNSIGIDLATKKINGLDRKFENDLELIGAANLINAFKKILKNRPAQSQSNPIYVGVDGNIAFDDRTIYEEIQNVRDRGVNGYGDTDIVKGGDLTFWKENTLKTISPTLYAHRRDFVEYLNKTGTFSEKITEETDYNSLKQKISSLNNGDKIEVNLKGEKIILTKINGISEVGVQSSEGKITIVNLENATIKRLGYTNSTTTGTTVVDRKFTDTDGHNNYYELVVTANALNNIKNKYEDRIYAAGLSAPGKNPGFKYEAKDKKIYFNESKEGGGIIKQEVMDDGFLISDFPKSFEGQENQIVTYLNNEVVIDPESGNRVLEYFKSRGIDVKLTTTGTSTVVESYGYKIPIDLTNKKLDTLGRQFQNHLELIGAANLVNLVKKILKDKSALSKDGVYIQFDGDAAFNDKTIREELKTYFNEGLHGYGDTDLREKNTLKKISPTLYANRREFVNYLNDNRTYNAETKQLQEKKARIEKALNNGMRNPITFASGGMTYDENSKELTITAINEDSISNDQMVNNNLDNVENFISRYNILESEDVKKIILPNINLEPGKAVSVKYLKKLLDLDEDKIQLGPDFLANREMIEFVAKKYDEGKFMKEENSKIDMNGIIVLNYIYDNGYDFNRLFNGEDDSRVDFAMRVMELLAGHRTIVDPTRKSIVELDKTIVKTPIKLPKGDDPIMKIRRVSRGENVDFGFSKNRQRRKNSDNIDIMNRIIENIHRYATQTPPIENVPYIHP